MKSKKIPCFVCKNDSWSAYWSKLIKCKNCGFVRAESKYFKINPNKLYDLDYFTKLDYEDYEAEKESLVQNFNDRIKRIKRHKKKGNLLEIGCAYGYFLSLAEKSFKTTGIDLHPSVTKIAKKNTKKSRILTGDFEKLKFKKDTFDVIVMFDVIEHLKNPDKYIKKAQSLLKNNGILVIETGDIEAILPKIQKSKWRLITPPTHLSYFSKTSLKNIITKNKLEIIETSHVPFFRTLNQTIFRLTRNKNLTRKITKLFNPGFSINTFDLIFITAKKFN